MELNPETVISAVGGAGGASALSLWMFKRAWTKIEERLDKHEEILNTGQVTQAKLQGKEEGEKALIWREIDTGKTFRVKTESELKKMWEILSRFANPRVSDAIKKALDDEE